MNAIQPIVWKNDVLTLLDQRVLPKEHVYIECKTRDDVVEAISNMTVRGAPAIGITAAYGVVIAARARFKTSPTKWKSLLSEDLRVLAAARPTAVNLVWAIERMSKVLQDIEDNPVPALLSEAHDILNEDIKANRRIGDFGAELITQRCSVLTHCNAGALATGGYGTALGVIRSAWEQGKIENVFANETRPWLQGLRLTAWELMHDNIPVTVQVDSAAAGLMKSGKVKWVIVGADRVTINGDIANKIGTYSLAILAQYHKIDFMVAAPLSTIDTNLEHGDLIPIEERPESEVTTFMGKSEIVSERVKVRNPAFDVVPSKLISAIVTEKGVVMHPTKTAMLKLLKS